VVFGISSGCLRHPETWRGVKSCEPDAVVCRLLDPFLRGATGAINVRLVTDRPLNMSVNDGQLLPFKPFVVNKNSELLLLFLGLKQRWSPTFCGVPTYDPQWTIAERCLSNLIFT